MNPEIQAYNNRQTISDKALFDILATIIDSELTESESNIWHPHPIWFLTGNPVVDTAKRKYADASCFGAELALMI